jgi:hypothetical protein
MIKWSSSGSYLVLVKITWLKSSYMANLAMRQHTFISFMCCPEWRGLLTVFRSMKKEKWDLKRWDYERDKTGDAWRQLILRHSQYNYVLQIVKTCRGSAYDHHSDRVAVSTETTTSDAVPSSINPTCIYSHKKKKIKWKYFAITNVVICHSLRSFANPTSQLTPNIRQTDVVDRSTIKVVSVIDRSHGFIAPRPLYTGPLCPTLE